MSSTRLEATAAVTSTATNVVSIALSHTQPSSLKALRLVHHSWLLCVSPHIIGYLKSTSLKKASASQNTIGKICCFIETQGFFFVKSWHFMVFYKTKLKSRHFYKFFYGATVKFSNCEEVKSTQDFGLCVGTVFVKKQPFHWQENHKIFFVRKEFKLNIFKD